MDYIAALLCLLCFVYIIYGNKPISDKELDELDRNRHE